MTGRTTHGHTRGRKTTPEFRTWCAMLQRCYDENSEKYARYGGRGIIVCERWRQSFEAFLADMGPRPAGKTIDRKNNDGNYERSNCRWATATEQANNRDTTRLGWKRDNTHCPHGHPYSGENLTVLKDGSRRCKQCDRLRAREYRKRKAAQANQDGSPKHPLYIAASVRPQRWAA